MKKVLMILVILITLVSIPLTVFYVGKQQELRKKAAPATLLSLEPSSVNVKVGDTFTLNVQIDTGTNQVLIAELHLQFDATKLEAVSITNADLCPKIYAASVMGPGTATITVGANSEAQPVTGTGAIARFTFKALAATSGAIPVQFTTDTFVGGLRESEPNVLSNTNPASVSISALSGTISPTTNPTILSGRSPTPSLTPNPTGAQGTVRPTDMLSENSTESGNTPEPTTTITESENTGLESTPEPTTAATESQTTESPASSDIITIESPADQSVVTAQPVFSGKAPAGSTVTIVIQSDPITTTVTADENGVWTYTPETQLPAGDHTVLASAENPNTGNVETVSGSFTVSQETSDAIGSDMPQSGSVENTLILLGISLLCIGIGILLPITRSRR